MDVGQKWFTAQMQSYRNFLINVALGRQHAVRLTQKHFSC